MVTTAWVKGASKGVSLLALSGVLLGLPLRAQTAGGAVPRGYTTPIPSELLTPDSVRTSVGTFNFFDGMPDAATVKASFDNLKFIRAYETFLTMMPAASIEMLRAGHASQGVTDHTKVMLMAPLNSNPLFLTGNTDTVYGSTFFNLKNTGPMVIEIPAGMKGDVIGQVLKRANDAEVKELSS